MSRLVVVTGTGTEIGKTHVAEAVLLRLAAARIASAGIKPVESGVGSGVSDAARLRAASSCTTTFEGVALSAPISPHLAAERQGVAIDLAALVRDIQSARAHVDVLLVELPGALFTPLTATALNVDLAASLRPDVVLLLAPDRLGVLHEVLATTRAAAHVPLPIHGVALIAPLHPDPSTDTNAAELARFTPVPVLATVPRGSAEMLARHRAIDAITAAIAPPRDRAPG